MLDINSIFALELDNETAKTRSNESLPDDITVETPVNTEETTISPDDITFGVDPINGTQGSEIELHPEKQSKEQKDIEEYDLSEESFEFKGSFVQSVEADDGDSIDQDMDKMDDIDPAEDAPEDDTGGGDDGWGDEGGDDGWGDGGDGGSDGDNTGGGDGSAGGVDDLDLNKGSSLNAFTQVNQKLYHIGCLNDLLVSIKNAIARYNEVYTDWSELKQLNALAEIVDAERNSFMMQENPENLIKLRLYQERYKEIVERLSVLIKEKAKNRKA